GKEETVTGVEMVYLKSDVEMHLYVEATTGFLAGPAEAGKLKAAAGKGDLPEKSHVVVKTTGPFHYDVPKELAWFDSPPAGKSGASAGLDQVLVSREHKAAKKFDQLWCEHLELQFRKKTDAPSKGARDPQSPDKEIDTALATART